eukprot:TRINITY_DN2776_c0_g1_i1.p1 TRINITY_DN2776_c0_g1~~TRINITY_DN2776_c0_g1_i1.p1  ORF type:complete len:125 (+),score=37.78 TRINITY_DN2776_c0_g1_i1:144-518(+)
MCIRDRVSTQSTGTCVDTMASTTEDAPMCAAEPSTEITNPVLKAIMEPGTPLPVLKFLYVVFFLLVCCSISLFWTELGVFHSSMVLFLSLGLIGSVTWFLYEFEKENGVGVDDPNNSKHNQKQD